MRKKLLLSTLLCASFLSNAQVNNALSFDGVDDAVSITNQPLKDASNFTIEANVRCEISSPDEVVFMQFYDATDGRFELRFDNGKLSVYNEKLGIQPSSTFTSPFGTYFKLVFVKNGTLNTLYANGLQVLTFNGNYSLGSSLQLGRYFSSVSQYNFKGKLDEIRFWNTAKTISSLNSLPKCGLTGTEANLVGYYNFNEGSAEGNNANYTSLPDKSSSKANGTLNNFALTGSISNWVASTTGCVEPAEENALSFDGENDEVAITKHGLGSATTFTIEARVKNESSNPDADVFMQFYDQSNTRFEIRINSGKLALYSEVLNSEPSSTFNVPFGKFFHMALVKNGQVTKLYADGVEVLTLNGSFSLGTGLKLGRYFSENGYSFKGQLDEVRLWNVAKTISEINAGSNCGLTGSEANLVGYYNFNQGSAASTNTGITTLKDLSASKLDGTLSNLALTGSSSNWVSSTACDVVPTSVANESIGNQISLFPNPALNFIEIKGAEPNSIVEIYSATGQLVLNEVLNGKIELPSSLNSGMYILNVKGSKTTKHVFVKQ